MLRKKQKKRSFVEEEKKYLRIGNNTVRLTVQDSWGRESSVEKKFNNKNGIDKILLYLMVKMER